MNQTVRIGIVGDFNPDYATHHAINASLGYSAEVLGLALESKWVATSCLERDAAKIVRNYHGVFIASGSPYRSMRGAMAAIGLARTEGRPLLAT